jgi:protein-tyrosine phosphatase
MSTPTITVSSDAPEADRIHQAARVLAEGGLVVLPTETVYGLAANAASEVAMERLRTLKGRVGEKPFTVHIGRISDCVRYVDTISALGSRLMRKGWPGPLTLVFETPTPDRVAVRSTLGPVGYQSIYGEKSVGIRYPDHVVASLIIREAGVPVVATSANTAGHAPPIDAGEIDSVVRDEADLIVDGGPSRYRKGSTVVALNGSGYRLIRTGVLDERTVQRMATFHLLFVCTGNTCRSPMAEGICRKLLADRLDCQPDELVGRGIVVDSAGVSAGRGAAPSQYAIDVCRDRGIDIADHRSHGVRIDQIRSADHIFAMTEYHVDVLLDLDAEAGYKTTTLLRDDDVDDPIGGSIADYRAVADKISRALEARLSEVKL